MDNLEMLYNLDNVLNSEYEMDTTEDIAEYNEYDTQGEA